MSAEGHTEKANAANAMAGLAFAALLVFAIVAGMQGRTWWAVCSAWVSGLQFVYWAKNVPNELLD